MRFRRSPLPRSVLGLLAMLGVAICASGAVAPALASGVTTLPFSPGVGFMAVDSAHGQVFVTGRPGVDDNVAVLDFTGSQVGTISIAVPGGLAINSGTLYVAS